MLIARRELQSGIRLWYHADRLGSIRLLTDSQGVKVKDYDYQPFGALAVSAGTSSNERGFAGQITDADAGLIYMRARSYDPALGTFLSPDSIVTDDGNPQDDNAYGYCADNPVNNIDPTGHAPIAVGGSLGGSAIIPIGSLLPPSSNDQGHFHDDARRNEQRDEAGRAARTRAELDERDQDTTAAARVRTHNGAAGHDDAVIQLPGNVTIKSDDLTFDRSTGWTRTIVLSDDTIIIVHLLVPQYDPTRTKDDEGHRVIELGGPFYRTTFQSPGQDPLNLAAIMLHPELRGQLSSDIQTFDYAIFGRSSTTTAHQVGKLVAPLTIPICPSCGLVASYFADRHAFKNGLIVAATAAGADFSDGAGEVAPELVILHAILGFYAGYYTSQ